ncbi:5'-methylthioadenosine/S-adenosylhomocysteine nucleosidase [Guggenheimella bovis]
MRRFGIIGPSKEEIENVLSVVEDGFASKVAGKEILEGKLHGHDVVIAECGICKVNAALTAQVLIDRFHVTDLIVVGVSGAIKKLKISDTVISTKVAEHDVEPRFLQMSDDGYIPAGDGLLKEFREIFKDSPHPIFFDTMVTGEAFIDQEGRDRIKKDFDPMCVDMETGGVAHVAYANDIPYIAIRSITDTEDESGIDVFRKNFEEARARAQEILLTYLKELA